MLGPDIRSGIPFDVRTTLSSIIRTGPATTVWGRSAEACLFGKKRPCIVPVRPCNRGFSVNQLTRSRIILSKIDGSQVCNRETPPSSFVRTGALPCATATMAEKVLQQDRAAGQGPCQPRSRRRFMHVSATCPRPCLCPRDCAGDSAAQERK